MEGECSETDEMAAFTLNSIIGLQWKAMVWWWHAQLWHCNATEIWMTCDGQVTEARHCICHTVWHEHKGEPLKRTVARDDWRRWCTTLMLTAAALEHLTADDYPQQYRELDFNWSARSRPSSRVSLKDVMLHKANATDGECQCESTSHSAAELRRLSAGSVTLLGQTTTVSGAASAVKASMGALLCLGLNGLTCATEQWIKGALSALVTVHSPSVFESLQAGIANR